MTDSNNKRGNAKALVGVVISDKMNKTVVVQVERLVKHPIYKKYMRRRSRFAAHDKANRCRIGDIVLIRVTRPLSRTKRWRISRVLERMV